MPRKSAKTPSEVVRNQDFELNLETFFERHALEYAIIEIQRDLHPSIVSVDFFKMFKAKYIIDF